eukprot:1826550-Rhodomonas_salina.2
MLLVVPKSVPCYLTRGSGTDWKVPCHQVPLNSFDDRVNKVTKPQSPGTAAYYQSGTDLVELVLRPTTSPVLP